MRFDPSRRRGYTLIEIAMVLAIAGVIIAAILVFFMNGSLSAKANDTLEELTVIQQVTRSFANGQDDYTWLATNPAVTLVGSGQFPNKWVVGGLSNPTGFTDPFGGAVTVVNSSVESGTNNTFTVNMTNIPPFACSMMVTQDMGTSMYSVTVGGQTAYGTSMDPVTANAGCATGMNSITWIFF